MTLGARSNATNDTTAQFSFNAKGKTLILQITAYLFVLDGILHTKIRTSNETHTVFSFKTHKHNAFIFYNAFL